MFSRGPLLDQILTIVVGVTSSVIALLSIALAALLIHAARRNWKWCLRWPNGPCNCCAEYQ